MKATFNGHKYEVQEKKFTWTAKRKVGKKTFSGQGNTPQEACQVCEQAIKEENGQEAIF